MIVCLGGYAQSSCIELNGSTDYINLGNKVGDSIRTIELWFSPSNAIGPSNTELIGLVVRNTNSQNINEFWLAFRPSGQPNAGALEFAVAESLNDVFHVSTDTLSWQANKWYHIAAVIHPKNGMILFVDGKMQSSNNNYTSPTAANNYFTSIGNWGNRQDLNRYFAGKVDDIRFSTKALYESNFTRPCPDIAIDSTTKAIYHLNAGKGNIAIDSSLNAYNGIINGGKWKKTAICNANAICLDGKDDYIDLGSKAANGTKTIELWFSPNEEIGPTLSNYSTLIGREHPGSNNIEEFNLFFTSTNLPNPGRLRFSVEESPGSVFSIESDTNRWLKGKWYHVAVVIDSQDGMRMFINGQQQSDTNAYNIPLSNSSSITAIGSWGNRTDLDRNFNGTVDAVQFSDEAIYKDDFIPSCKTITPSVGRWDFNEKDGNVAIDSSVNQYHGRLMGNPERVSIEYCPEPQKPTSIFNREQENNLQVYPNPSSGNFLFKWHEPDQSPYHIRIFNTEGRLIGQWTSTSKNTIIDIQKQPPGIYLFQANDKKGLLYQGKLLKR